MYQLVSVSQFRDAFRDMGRDDQFSYEGLGRLFDYLEDMDGADQPGMELDVIGLCCDYVEMTLDEVCEQYPDIEFDADDEDSQRDAVEEYLIDNTSLIGIYYVGGEVYALFVQF